MMNGSSLMKAIGGSELLGLGRDSASVKSDVGCRGIRMAEICSLTAAERYLLECDVRRTTQRKYLILVEEQVEHASL